MQLSERCMTLRRLIISSEPLTVAELQLALQWQHELLRSSLVNQSLSPAQRVQQSPEGTFTTSPLSPLRRQDSHRRAAAPSSRLRPSTTTEGKPSSLSSFDSGFDGAGSLLEGPTVTPDFGKQTPNQPQIHPQIQEETASGLTNSDWFGSLGHSSRDSVHFGPKAPHSGLDFEIKVKRSAAHPSNPWLSLPGDNLESSYTVTITPKPLLEHRDPAASQIDKDLSPLTPELGPIAHILSSTVTDPKDHTCTPGDPSMLWDSYDLHKQFLDATEGVSALSLEDWAIKEQENLTAVERILERADKILAEEESVFAQEAQLDDLLQSEVGPHPWLAWDNQMSSAELTVTNGPVLDQVGAESQSDPDLMCPQTGGWRSKPNLLTELIEVHALDQKILEENVKIHQLRRGESPQEIQRKSDTQNRQSTSRSQLAKEQSEQGNLEKDSSVRTCQTETHGEQSAKVIRCSIMSRTESEEDGDICNGLLSGKRSFEGLHSEGKSKDTFTTSSCNKTAIVGSSEECLNGKAELGGIYSAQGQTDERLANLLNDPLTELPASRNKSVTCIAPVQPVSDPLSVRPDSTVREREVSHPYPIPKPRTTTALALNLLRQQHTVHPNEDRNVSLKDYGDILCEPTVDTRDTSEPTVDTRDTSEPTVDTRDTSEPTVDTRDTSEPTVDTRDTSEPTVGTRDTSEPTVGTRDTSEPTVGTRDTSEPTVGTRDTSEPTVGTRDTSEPTVGTRDTSEPTVGTRDTSEPTVGTRDTSEPTVGTRDTREPTVGTRDTREPTVDTVDRGESLSQGINAELHINNNNNNRLPSLMGSGETDVPEEAQQTEDLTILAHSYPRVETGPSTCTMYNLGTEEDGTWSEGTKISAPELQDPFNISSSLPADFETPIVLDTGSGLMKAGFANEDLPSIVFPTIIGVPKYEEIINGSSEKDLYVGHEAQHMRGVLALRHPIQNGHIRNWDDMEKIWQQTFNLLRVDPSDHPVMLTEAP
uniref:Uncharacterized protein n=1 Tax=Neogobius melanostomus TaxID=47308 RepID=A0A8C6S6I7_9GOBI